MKQVRSLFLAIFIAGICAPLGAMQPAIIPLKKEDYTLKFSPESSSLNDVIAAINEAPQGGLVAMNGSFICHEGLVDALKNAQARGVRLELCVDARKSENTVLPQQLPNSDIKAVNCFHTKRCLVFDIDPKGDAEAVSKARVKKLFTGSENLSNNAGTHHEYTFISQDLELVKCHYEDHLLNVAVCQPYLLGGVQKFDLPTLGAKQDLPTSPRMTKVYNSQRYDMGVLKAQRISKSVPAGVKEFLYVSSMGFDDERVVNALLAKARTGSVVTLIVDKAAAKSERGLRHLNTLHSAGVKIFVWEGSSIQHTKLLLRERRNALDDHYLDALSVLSTGNLVKNSCAEVNYDQVVPESHVLSQEIRAYFDKLKAICTPFEKVDQQAIAQKKANKGKDLVSLNCGTCNERIGAPAEKTLVKKFLKHCVQDHQGKFENTAALENVGKKELYCVVCSECSEPFYNQKSVASVTLALSKHLIKEHMVSETKAKALRKDMKVAKAAFYIASLN